MGAALLLVSWRGSRCRVPKGVLEQGDELIGRGLLPLAQSPLFCRHKAPCRLCNGRRAAGGVRCSCHGGRQVQRRAPGRRQQGRLRVLWGLQGRVVRRGEAMRQVQNTLHPSVGAKFRACVPRPALHPSAPSTSTLTSGPPSPRPQFFPGIPKIKYEGPKSTNPLAFRCALVGACQHCLAPIPSSPTVSLDLQGPRGTSWLSNDQPAWSRPPAPPCDGA